MKKILNILLLLTLPVLYLSAQTEVEISTEKVVIDGYKYYLHTVASGQTLYSICKKYNANEDEILKLNTDIQNKTLKLGQVIKIPIVDEISADGTQIVYTVKPGDTLYALCRNYGITEDEFYVLNPNIKKNKPLKIGVEINFPIKVVNDKDADPVKDTSNFYYHLIEKGETVYGLTRTYNVTKEELMAVNPDFDGIKLLVGDVIKIPKKENVVIDTQHQLLDSLANVNIKPEDTVKVVVDVCDEKQWYTHGKSFEIVILLPFETGANLRNLANQSDSKREQRLYQITEKMISFYSGCLISLEQFKTFDVNLNVKVYDIGKDNSVIQRLIEDKSLDNTDMIIGPAFRSQVDYLNTNLTNEKAVVLLPFIDDAEVLEKYDNNIMLRPSTAMVVDAVADFAALNPENLYFVIQGTTEEQIEIAGKYKDALVAKLGSEANVVLVRFTGKDLASVKTLVQKGRENIFILPFNTETSCTNIFLDLFPLKDYDVTLLADPAVLEYETIDPGYYSRVKFSYYTGVNVDYKNDATKKFVADYRETFLCEPDEFAFLAYDAISYFGLRLVRFGNDFTQCISKNNSNAGIAGFQEYNSKPGFSPNSFSNSKVYIFTLQEDFSFIQVFPQIAE